MASLMEMFFSITADSSPYKKAMQEAGDATQSFTGIFSSLEQKIAASIGFTAIATGIITAAEEFEKAAFKIQRATGATGAALDSLDASMKKLYANSGQTEQAIAAALSEVTIKTGLQGVALESLTK